MPYQKKTLSDLKQLLADKIAAGVVPTSSATLAYWIRQLNAGQAYCAETLRLAKSTSLTTVSGTIAVPDDFIFPDKVVNSSDVDMQQISPEDSADAVEGQYWITGTHFDGFYLNTVIDQTVTLWYIFRPSEMVNDSDKCIIADPLAVVCYAYSKLRKAQTDPLGDADGEMGECIRRTNELSSHIVKNDTGSWNFSLPANS
jgi:hypothetical protein